MKNIGKTKGTRDQPRRKQRPSTSYAPQNLHPEHDIVQLAMPRAMIILIEAVLLRSIALKSRQLPILELLTLAHILQLRIARREELVEVVSHTLAQAIGVISRRNVSNGHGGANICVAEPVGEVLELLGCESDPVLEDQVVCWACGAGSWDVRLQEEVEVVGMMCDTRVDACALLAVAILLGVVGWFERVEAGVVALGDDYGGDLGFCEGAVVCASNLDLG